MLITSSFFNYLWLFRILLIVTKIFRQDRPSLIYFLVGEYSKLKKKTRQSLVEKTHEIPVEGHSLAGRSVRFLRTLKNQPALEILLF